MRVLVLRALKLGDFLTGVPAYRAIRRAYPEARIQLAAPAVFRDLLDLIGGSIDEIVNAGELEALPRAVYGADLGIDLHGKGAESHVILVAAGVRRLIAFRDEAVPESYDGPEHDPHEHEVERWCRLLRAAGIPADANDLNIEIPNVPVPPSVRGATLIHPGAASESRRWPIDRWIAVARAERSAGRGVVITGGPSEIALARAIASGAGVSETDVYAGRTSLRDLVALVGACARVVCGDTGIAHVASALRRPSVLLFGPTPPSTWGPPVRPIHRVLWNGTTGDPHGTRVDPGLAAISSASVIAALETLSSADGSMYGRSEAGVSIGR